MTLNPMRYATHQLISCRNYNATLPVGATDNSLSDFNFINAVIKFMENKESYTGNASELSALLSDMSVDNYSKKFICKNLKRLSRSLEKAEILSNSRRSNGARIIEIIKISVDSDDETCA